MKDIEELLIEALGKEVDLTIVHHVEGLKRSTTGILKTFNENLIVLEMEWKNHWFSRKTENCLYYLNRKSCSILSVVILR